MATLTFNGTSNYVKINPITTAINNTPNGAATIAAMCRVPDSAADYDLMGLRGGDLSGGYYHGLRFGSGAAGNDNDYSDDNGITFSVQTSGPMRPVGATGDNFFIVGEDWPASNAATRLHGTAGLGSAESWTHIDYPAANGGLQAGPGTGTGFYLLGNYDGAWFKGDIALLGIWSGVRLSDANWEDLWISKKTSDWWNNPAGQPNTLIEFTSTSPTDIGANPVSSIVVTGATATGADPTGWTFDGRGSVTPTTDEAALRTAHTPVTWRT